MRSVLTVTTAAAPPLNLTTLDRVKQELDITDSSKDVILATKIAEASSDIEAFLGFSVAQEVVSETFWQSPQAEAPEFILLDRTPVATIASVTLDDVVIDSGLYRLHAETGLLYSLDASGYPCRWFVCKAMVVAYTGGHVLPGESGRNLPYAIEAATVDLVQSFWFARGRDGMIKSEEIPGVMRQDFWVGAVGQAGQLPPSVQSKLAPFRRASA